MIGSVRHGILVFNMTVSSTRIHSKDGQEQDRKRGEVENVLAAWGKAIKELTRNT